MYNLIVNLNEFNINYNISGGIFMKLNNTEVYNFLKEQGITYFYHANTVGTACTFLQQGGLLSRGAVEHLDLFQTRQSSDKIDMDFDVWNDIFLDTVDLHELFPRYNYYGPVLFKINLDIILQENLPDIYITKDNPIRWSPTTPIHEYYFNSVDELRTEYEKGSYREMFTLKNTLKPLFFNNFLEEVILDNPKLDIKYNEIKRINPLKEAKKLIRKVSEESRYDYSNVKFSVRKDCIGCYCYHNYMNSTKVEDLERYFLDNDLNIKLSALEEARNGE